MLAALLVAAPASAGPMVMGEVVTTPLSVGQGETDAELGMGVGLRVGMPIDIVLVELVPEVGATVYGFGNDSTTAVLEAGGRFNVGKVVEPGVYGHALLRTGPHTRVGWDAGLSLDVTVIPFVDFGVQSGVMRFDGAPAVTVGAHAGIKL